VSLPSSIQDIETPALLLDETRMQRNIERMQSHLASLGVAFRPHVKTSKCIQVAQRQRLAGARGITVSTLKEAEEFFQAGFDDILYAVAIAPGKLDHALRLCRQGLSLTLVVESVAAAQAISEHGKTHAFCHRVLIEVDTDGHRSGIKPHDPLLLQVASALHQKNGHGAVLHGVMTHAGGSYDLNTPEALAAMAEQERSRCEQAAQTLRQAGFDCPTVSVGSTPTALNARSLDGVTEVRAGVYVFFDLVMANIGVCSTDDIAVSVLCSVIGHRADTGWVITDGGWMAMSRDRGTQKQGTDYGYGQVCDRHGAPLSNLAFETANQEHGVLAWQGEPGIDLAQRFPLGTLLRIQPNHACATTAQHGQYHVINAQGQLTAIWPRFNGW
jgi:D-serine deaminase-like pyridoxal phosphate-dependent protein